MSNWKLYRRKGVVEYTPFDPTKPTDGISISAVDTPCHGGMVCRNPGNHKDMWYVNPEFFVKHFEEINGN